VSDTLIVPGYKPEAPHLKLSLADGTRRAWYQVEMQNVTDYARPESQGGTWVLAQRIRILGAL
jgi:hypothetical protein